MWHLVEHLTKAQGFNNELISFLLRATEKNKERNQPRKIKSAVTVLISFDLLKEKHGEFPEHNMIITLALCAFWGMA